MKHPVAVIEKAQRMEKLLQRVATGEPLNKVRADLGVSITEKRLSALQAMYKKGGNRWEALLDGRYGHEQKVNSAMREWLYERKKEDDDLRSSQLVREIEEKFGIQLSIGHINHLLRQRGMAAPPGRPQKKGAGTATADEREPNSEVSMDQAGIFFPGSGQGSDGGNGEG